MRKNLMVSAGVMGLCAALFLPSLAHAETTVGPTVDDVASSYRQDDATRMSSNSYLSIDDLVNTPHISIRNPYTHQDAYDPNKITGIGQIVVDQGSGYIGTCTSTLINQRTILFAAHCVNNQDAKSYGSREGGTAIGVGFETNTRANAAGQTDELVRWLLGGTGGAGQFVSNKEQHFYNLNQVFWHEESRQGASCVNAAQCYHEADIATGVLDTPAAGVPTWALLFSPLPAPDAIDPVNGTGYHVSISGYGAYGVGAAGAATSGNYRRRAAENMLGALTSLSKRDDFLFGSPSNRTQLLYFIDFDDPNRGTATGNGRDFNGFRDNALAKEGLTGPGDTGGPLILDETFDRSVVIGVLSGGSTFYTGQNSGSYGTQSFYQPLFLYWDWIAANNPYHYVTAASGQVNWEDGTTWRTEIDPNYHIIVNGELVNGLPSHLGSGLSSSGLEFGEMCFQSPSNAPNPSYNECYDLATGEFRTDIPNAPTDNDQSGLPTDLSGTNAATGHSSTPISAPSLANGLPGASGFIANNYDGDRVNGVIGRYFDVTLRNEGTVRLSSAVTIDKFAIMGATTQLAIAEGGSLTSLTEIQQNTGVITNDGVLRSAGDYLLLSGLLQGSGRIVAPFTTSVLGSIAPGGLNNVGTMTFDGSLILSSGSNVIIDIGVNEADKIVVTGSANVADLGGALTLNVGVPALQRARSYDILTAEGGVLGEFDTVNALSDILTYELRYLPQAVQVEIIAANYADVIDVSDPNVAAWANLLDSNRSLDGTFSTLYSNLDMADADVIIDTLKSFTPATEAAAVSMGMAAASRQSKFIGNRLSQLNPSNLGGTLAQYGRPLQLAALNLASAGSAVQSDVTAPLLREGKLPERMSGFVAGGYVDGSSAAMAGTGKRDKFDGWFMGAGLETAIGETGLAGLAFFYSKLDGQTAFASHSTETQAYTVSLYGKGNAGGLRFDGQMSIGSLKSKSERKIAFFGEEYRLTSSDNSRIVDGEVAVGYPVDFDDFEILPRAVLRGTWIDLDKVSEKGGEMALEFDRPNYKSYRSLFGAAITTKTGRIRPFADAYYVYEMNSRPEEIRANLVGGVGSGAVFALSEQDRHWAEISAGVSMTSGNFEISLSAASTAGRSDLSVQNYTGSVRYRF